MAFTDAQVRQLKAKLDPKYIKTRSANGVNLSYVEGWHVIDEANRIFGFDAWDRRTFSTACVWSGQSGQCHAAAYTAKVRVSVRAGDITIVREGSGTGKEELLPRRKHMSWRLKVPRPTPPSERLPPLATPSGLPSTTESRLASEKRVVLRYPLSRARKQVLGCCVRALPSPSQAMIRQEGSSKL